MTTFIHKPSDNSIRVAATSEHKSLGEVVEATCKKMSLKPYKGKDVKFEDQIIALIEEARRKTASAVNLAMVCTYYEVGRRIVVEEQKGQARANYGEKLLERLSKALTAKFGRGYSLRNVRNMRGFYLVYSQSPIRQTASAESRLALSRDKKKVLQLSTRGQIVEKPEDALKDPYVLEFTGLPELPSYTESQLEQRLIDHLQEFMLEMGKGFTFAGRQVRISDSEDRAQTTHSRPIAAERPPRMTHTLYKMCSTLHRRPTSMAYTSRSTFSPCSPRSPRPIPHSANHAYVPVLFETPELREKVYTELKERCNVYSRRYFYPLLTDFAPYIYARNTCPIAQDIASRVLTLPTYYGLPLDDVRAIAQNVLEILG